MRVILFACLAAGLLCARSACAQGVPAVAPRPPAIGVGAGDSGLLIDRQRLDRAPPAVPATNPAPAPAPVAAPTAVTPFTLRMVRIEGATLPQALLQAATAPFTGRTIDGAGLAAVATAISAQYEKNGDIALYTVVVPPQDFADGVLRIAVLEGYVESVTFTGDTGGGKADLSLAQSYASRIIAARPLTRRVLTRYLGLLRDIPGLTADARILTGGAPGAARLAIDIKRKAFEPSVTLDNQANALLGQYQVTAQATLNALIRQGDVTRVTFAAPFTIGRFRYGAISHTTPIGDDGLTATAGYSALVTHPKAYAGGLSQRGQAQTLQLALGYPLIRGQDENLFLGASLDGIDSTNALIGYLPVTENIRSFRASAAWSAAADGGKRYASLSGTLSKGLSILDARTLSPFYADPDYVKFSVNGLYALGLGQDYALRARLSAQLGASRLPAAEMFTPGGDVARAFSDTAFLGDSGIAGGLEAAWIHAIPLGYVSLREVYVFGDRGGVWSRGRLGGPGIDGGTASLGAGLRLAFGESADLKLEAARAMIAELTPPFVPRTRVGGWRIGFAYAIHPAI